MAHEFCQRSKFSLSLDEMRQLFYQVKKQVKESEDNVQFHWILEEVVSRVLTRDGESPKPPPTYYVIWVLGTFKGNFQKFIDASPQMAETLPFSLRCVDGLQGKGLSYANWSIFTADL